MSDALCEDFEQPWICLWSHVLVVHVSSTRSRTWTCRSIKTVRFRISSSGSAKYILNTCTVIPGRVLVFARIASKSNEKLSYSKICTIAKASWEFYFMYLGLTYLSSSFPRLQYWTLDSAASNSSWYSSIADLSNFEVSNFIYISGFQNGLYYAWGTVGLSRWNAVACGAGDRYLWARYSHIYDWNDLRPDTRKLI
jgi:hypothetical protein